MVNESERQQLPVYIVSDATGITAERVINAVLVQFKATVEPIYERLPFVKSEEEIRSVFRTAQAQGGIIIYSLASEQLRSMMAEERRRSEILTIDLLGPLLDQVGKLMNAVPALRPGLMERYGDESYKLTQAIHYTIKHDDGQNPTGIMEADLLILGVSRTSKTPTSFFLACHHNLKVANVPIIKDIEPPHQVFAAGCRKIGFVITPSRLAFLRTKRFKDDALPTYTDKKSIIGELKYCKDLYRRIPGIQIIDVSNTPIEEVANRIV